jgi:four helix bundle protein
MGSLMECLDWLKKAKVRNLISENEYDRISTDINRLPKEINILIKYIDKKLKY